MSTRSISRLPLGREQPAPELVPLVQAVHEAIFGRPHVPAPTVAFYPYAEGRSLVRPRDGRMHFRLNSSLLGAPDEVVRGLVGLLWCRVRGVPDERAPAADAKAYRAWTVSAERSLAASLSPKSRKHIDPVGTHRSLLESFLRVSLDMGLTLPMTPKLSWSRTVSGHRFGHWDPEHGVVVVSQILDDPEVPEFVLDYVVYHELLHIVHPVRMGSGTKRIVHSAAFRRDERRFPRWKEGDEWIERLARRARRARG